MKKMTALATGFGNVTGAMLAVASGGSLLGVIVLIVSLLAATPSFAQDREEMGNIKVEMREVERELGQAAIEIQHALDEAGIETGIQINFDDEEGSDRPKLGVYLSDMDFEDAYKMRYPYPHGTLIDGTVRNGNADKAGLIEDDIIMYFDGTKVLYEDHLVRLIRSQHFGDQVEVVYWRDEAMDTTIVTFAAPEKKDVQAKLEVVKKEEEQKKRRNSRGFGGGGFTPMLVQNDFQDIGDLMTELGLTKTPFSSDGLLMWGGSGQGFVGNGWFLGGFGQFGGMTRSTASKPHSTSGETAKRDISFHMGFGGLTVEKRFAPFKFMVIGGGTGLGFGGIDLKVTQADNSAFQWDWTTLNDQLIDTKTTTINFSKAYAIAHPRVNAMIRLTSWMRLRAEVGYLYAYPFSPGWEADLTGGNIEDQKDGWEIQKSPDTDINSQTISLGLWFGF
ncbi:MAG: PDZ domain-containing protein [Candidatus Marinimicrobia bacterium]|nr:PDZ domain-containing protein [Candidatus Neomarinimicrobiota bacterium]MCF7851469.1 PDZ domain-containing protein [Candidatus Neomarinimicrobiota bacterium]MCF7904090.1 PDZ domain-containing protein [Candidatus Neomarinimicrobiota bacterium]